MRGYVAPADRRWFDFHCARGTQREVNFWTPSGRGFSALETGEPFFFKLKAPESAIGGFGIFLRAEVLPLWLAWDSFGVGNGTRDQATLVDHIRSNRAHSQVVTPTSPIGCRLLSDPIFFPRDLWVDPPKDWQNPIVAGKRYDLLGGEGARVWRDCLERAGQVATSPPWTTEALAAARFGKPTVIRPRLGQGGFRLAVYDAYDRACCVTGEHSLPVLEAAHIRPYAQGGEHLVTNGLPLRRDLHRLFDLGYVTVSPDFVFTVGERLRVEYHNGRSYYQLHGQQLRLPKQSNQRPSAEFLEWHNERIYRAS